MTWAGKVVPGPRKPDSSDTLQSRSGLEDLALHLRRHANGLEGRSVVRHMDRPAARLDGSTDRLIHALLPARHLLPGPCPVDTHHESIHCVPPEIQRLTAPRETEKKQPQELPYKSRPFKRRVGAEIGRHHTR